MSESSKKQSRRSASKGRRGSSRAAGRERGSRIDRPFAPDILRQARNIAAQYGIVIRREADSGFVGESVELPLNVGVGDTVEECLSETREVLTSAIAAMLERGQRPPSAASEGKREVQLNIRLTADERLRLEEAARQAGFRSISDYVRSAALRRSA